MSFTREFFFFFHRLTLEIAYRVVALDGQTIFNILIGFLGNARKSHKQE